MVLLIYDDRHPEFNSETSQMSNCSLPSQIMYYIYIYIYIYIYKRSSESCRNDRRTRHQVDLHTLGKLSGN
jgi:hypothetical protein